jgi:TonB family protein
VIALNECNGDITPMESVRYHAASLVSEDAALTMNNLALVARLTFLVCSCFLLATIQAQSPEQQSHEEAVPVELAKVCSAKNPPPCATPPRAISAPSAQFSESRRGKEFDGVCTLSVNVEPDGRTSHIRVLRSVGKDLDQKAINAVKGWKFEPAKLDGKPVAVQIAVQVSFHLY